MAYGDITDIEVGLSIGYQRDLQAVAANAQAVVNRIAGERDNALREIARLRAQLAVARGEINILRLQSARARLHG